MRILVTTSRDADDRKTLAAVRALGRRGHRVYVGADHALSPAAWSRFCRRWIRLPSALADPNAHRDAVLEAARHLGARIVLPLSDDTTRPLLAEPGSPPTSIATALPTPAAWTCTHDKLALQRLAAEVGISSPRTWTPADRAEVEDLAPRLDYPVVLKLRRGAAAAGLAFPSSPARLLDAYDARPRRRDAVVDGEAVLVQDFEPGVIHDLCLLAAHGRIVAAVTQRRLRMHPPSGGVGVICETTREPALERLAAPLIEALAWHGPAQVEFVRRRADGRPLLLEVNGRFWGTLDLAIQAGVDFAELTCRLARGEAPARRPPYRVGLRYRWPWPYGVAGPRGARAAFFAPQPASRSDLWPTDPLPHAVQALGLLARRRALRTRRRA